MWLLQHLAFCLSPLCSFMRSTSLLNQNICLLRSLRTTCRYPLLTIMLKYFGPTMISVNNTGDICNNEARSGNNCCSGKSITILYSECVSVASVMNRTKRMRRVVPLFVACLAGTYFVTLSHKRHVVMKNVTEH